MIKISTEEEMFTLSDYTLIKYLQYNERIFREMQRNIKLNFAVCEDIGVQFWNYNVCIMPERMSKYMNVHIVREEIQKMRKETQGRILWC